MAGDGWKSEGAFAAVINLLTALIYCARRRARGKSEKCRRSESRRAPPATLCMTPSEIDFFAPRGTWAEHRQGSCFIGVCDQIKHNRHPSNFSIIFLVVSNEYGM